jgi:hypothetical protein
MLSFRKYRIIIIFLIFQNLKTSRIAGYTYLSITFGSELT